MISLSRESVIASTRSMILKTVQDEDLLFGLFRHGQKQKGIGDISLTEHGQTQVSEAAGQFQGEILNFLGRSVDLVMVSGLQRAYESAERAQDVLDLDFEVQVEMGLNPFTIMEELFPGNSGTVLTETAEIRAVNDTVAYAREVSRFAKRGMRVVQEMLLRRADQMVERGQRTAMGFSHSPWVELAVTAPTQTRYGLEEAEAVVYVVRRREIILGVTLLPPIEGDRL